MNYKKNLLYFSESKTIIILLLSLITFLYILSLFIFKGLFTIDIDLGWQIRMGNWILHHGIPKTDPLSYTMPSYPYINHEWLTNIIFYALYMILGIPGLTVAFVGITFLAIWIQVPRRQLFWSLLVFLLVATIFLTYFDLIAQVVSWLLFSICLKIAFDEHLWEKWKWVIPFVMLLWVNIHGSFVLGLLILVFVNVNHFLNRKIIFRDLSLLLLCILITFINPYGFGMYHEIFMHLQNSDIKNHFGRWMPLYYSINGNTLFYIFYICVSYLLIVFSKTKIPLYKILFLSCMLLAGFSGIIYIPFYVLTSIPLLTSVISHLYSKAQKQKTRKNIFEKIFTCAFCLLVIICILVAVNEDMSISTLTEEKVYPKNAILYLKNHMPKNQIMSVYEWGGYLDWKLPEKKVYIDGRMLVWSWNKDGKNESKNVFVEDESFLSGKIPLSIEAKKYSIDTILFPVPLSAVIKKQLQKDNWKLVYKDTVSVIYKLSK